MRLREHHRKIIAAFREYGIEPSVEETGTGHVRFRWSYGGKDGKPMVVATSPSDWRAVHNEVSRVHRFLRAAGATPLGGDEGGDHAACQASIAALANRITRLEGDIAMLLDRLTQPDPEPVIAQQVDTAVQEQPRADCKKVRYRWLLAALRYDEFLPRQKIAEEAGRTLNAVSVGLSVNKADGLVEHRPGVGWRKHWSVEQLLSS